MSCAAKVKGIGPMQVEVFSDVVCPWCYIGKRRLEEALSTFPHADDVTVTYRSFQLDPTTPVDVTGTLADRLATKYGVTGEQATAMNDRVSGIAETVGLDFHLDHAHPANTFSSHRLLHFAGTRGLQAELKERLMRAYFTEGVNLGERNELIRLATEVGSRPRRGRDGAGFVGLHGRGRGRPRPGPRIRDLAVCRSSSSTGPTGSPVPRSRRCSSEVLERAWSESHPLTMVTARGSAGVGVTGQDDGDLACDDDSCAV